MTTIVRAKYENQVLRLEAPLDISEGVTLEFTLNLPEKTAKTNKRFSWEAEPILPKDSYVGDVSEEVRRQRNAT